MTTQTQDRVFYVDTGEKDLLPVVFIHGFPFASGSWTPQLNALHGRHRTVAYDVRGHGKSALGAWPFTLEALADDLFALLDRLSIERAVLCGLSMGGYIALRAYQKAPARVRALALCDTRPDPDSDETKLRRAAAIGELRRDPRAFLESFLKVVLAKSTLERRPEVVEAVRTTMLDNEPASLAAALVALATRTDSTPQLKSIAVPALVVVGKDDAVTPPAVAEAMAKAIPGAELKVLEGAGHLSNLENPKAFNQALLEFLAKLK